MVMPAGWTPCQPLASADDFHSSGAAPAGTGGVACSGDARSVARQCLQFRGVLPAVAERAEIDKGDAATLHHALRVVRPAACALACLVAMLSLLFVFSRRTLRAGAHSARPPARARPGQPPPGPALTPLPPFATRTPQAQERGLTRPGDRVVISQCPRVVQKYADRMLERGVVKILTLGADGVATRVASAVLDSAGHVVGSVEEDEADLV